MLANRINSTDSGRILHRALFAICSIGFIIGGTTELSSAASTSAFSPTTSISAQTSVNTSASSLFTDYYYSYETGKYQSNANGDMVPANISKLSLASLLTGDAANAKIYAYTQSWFCHSASNVGSNGLLVQGTSPETPKCGSHIDIGYNSGDATQVAETVADMQSRGFNGVLIDWEGAPADDPASQTNIQNNNAVIQYQKNAEASNGAFTFAVIEDEGVAGCTKGWVPCQVPSSVVGDASTMSPATLQVIYDLNYAVANFTGSSAYLRNSAGAAIIETFGLDGYASAAVGGAQTIDWTAVEANLPLDPLKKLKPVLMFENATGMTHSETGGAYSWVSPTAWSSYSLTSGDPFSLNYLAGELSQLIADRNNSSAPLVIAASAFKGFDDTVVDGWGSGSRYVDQQCGKTLLQSIAKVNTAFASQSLNFIGIPTWDDYEEATETETGIDNCLTGLSPRVSGATVSWAPVFGTSIDGVQGDESTVHHYVVYVSQNGYVAGSSGYNLMPLPNVASGTHSLDLSQFGLPTGTYQVYVQAVGMPMMRNTFAQAAGSFTVAPTTGTISGTITNLSTGAAISGVAVSYSAGSTTTNSSGQFTFTAVTPGSYTVKASYADYLANSASVTVVAGAAANANIALTGAGVIAGTVTSSSGAAISGASVSISGGVPATTLSYTGASFATSLIPIGTYTVTCSSASYAPQTSSVNLTLGATLNVACSLKPLPGTITGQVTSASTGAAISGVSVSYSGGSTTTNSNGNYTFTNVPAGTSTITVSATDSGYLANSDQVAVSAGATVTANIKIATAGVISGTVTNSSGAALSGAAVSVAGGVIATNLGFTGSSFNTSWIPVGTYSVTCSNAGYAPQTSSVSLASGKTATVACALKPLTGTITGQVTNASTGAAVSGATVSYSGGSTTTNSSGNYTFTSASVNTFTISASDSDYLANSAQVTVSVGTTVTANIKLTGEGTITGAVKSSSGAALSGASVSILGGVPVTTLSYTGSSFNTGSIPIGTYTVTCSDAGYSPQTSSVSLTLGATLSVACSLKPLTGTITGQVTSASTGGALSGVTVSYSGGSTTTNNSGNYTFNNVSAGTSTITVSATDSGYLANSDQVTVTAGATTTANIKISTAGIIAGTVETSSGAAYSGANVTITGGDISTTISLTSGSTGKFTTSWIPVGSYTVTCTASSKGTGKSTVSLTAGETLSVTCKM